MNDNPIIIKIIGNNNFHSISKFKISWQHNNKITPTAIPTVSPVLSLSVNNPIKHGTIIKSV